MTIKSPFVVIPNFISPSLCEQIVDNVGFNKPVINNNGVPLASSVRDDEYDQVLFARLKPHIKSFEQYYDFQYSSTERFSFEWLPLDCQMDVHCENAEYRDNAWIKNKNRDFTGVIFLCNFNERAPFDTDFECYGGKLEFINHQFSFNPNRGTLVLFPSEPRFCNASSRVIAGDAYQARFHIAAKSSYIHDMSKFPGDYRSWF
jgi:hypothetical protein